MRNGIINHRLEAGKGSTRITYHLKYKIIKQISPTELIIRLVSMQQARKEKRRIKL